MIEPFKRPNIITHSIHLAQSFRHWTGKELITPQASPQSLAEALYHAPFVLVADDAQPDPVFCYANLTAQKLWNMDWDKFTALPSRLSAKPMAQEDRDNLKRRANEQGYIDNYQGIRVTSEGKEFRIENCILWKTLNDKNERTGQAAMFDRWEWL